MRQSAKFLSGITAALTALALSACGTAPTGDSATGSGKLEVFSWWTSGSEAAALDTLFAAFKAKDPNTQVVNAAVSGGGGATARQVLATRLQGGNPPDSWQLHPDQDLAQTAKDGSIADLTEMYKENGWADKLPPQVAKMLQVDGKYYAVPVNAHRTNVLWTNPSVLKSAGVALMESTSLDELLASLPKLSAAGVTPLCLGDKDIFASAELLESVILSKVGADGWRALFTGGKSFDSPEIRSALGAYDTLLAAANKDHAAVSWDQAMGNLTAGKCAVTLMGDWAYGEMVNKGKKEGTDFGYLSFPGNNGTFMFNGDAFVMPAAKGPNPTAERTWLSIMLEPKVQKDFNLAKGSVPIRTDVSLDGFPAYQKQAAEALRSKPVVSSLSQGLAAPGEFSQTYADAVSTFNGDHNVDAFVSTMVNAQKTKLHS